MEPQEINRSGPLNPASLAGKDLENYYGCLQEIDAKNEPNSVITPRQITGSLSLIRCLDSKIKGIYRQFFQLALSQGQEVHENEGAEILIARINYNNKMRKYQNPQNGKQLRRITEKDQDSEQLEHLVHFIVDNKFLLQNSEDQAHRYQRKEGEIIKCKPMRDLNENFLFRPRQITIREQLPIQLAKSALIQSLPLSLSPFQELSSSTPQLKGPIPQSNGNELKTIQPLNIPNGCLAIFENFSFGPSPTMNKGGLPIKIELQGVQKATNFGSSALEFKNSLLRQKQKDKEEHRNEPACSQIGHSQRIERKTMPVRLPLAGQLTGKPDEQREIRKLVKIKSKYQGKQQDLSCCSPGCFRPEIQTPTPIQKPIMAWTKKAEVHLFNSELCMSQQIKESIASTNYKASSNGEGEYSESDSENENLGPKMGVRKMQSTSNTVVHTLQSPKMSIRNSVTFSNAPQNRIYYSSCSLASGRPY